MTSAFPYNHIACCVDGSAAARVALEEAIRLRAMGPGRLSIVHVATAPTLIGYSRFATGHESFFQTAREWLDALTASVPGAEGVLLWGHPATQVEQWARETECDLLIAASHTGAVERTLLGGFSRTLAHHAPCPLLLTRPRPPSDIAAAVDHSGRLFADAEHALTLDAAWSPEHLLLAAVARRVIASLGHRAAERGIEARGRATASADLGTPGAAPSLDAVRVGIDVEVVPEPDAALLAALLGSAERDTCWALPLARPVQFGWRVNGREVERR